jgi:hypothetical protein
MILDIKITNIIRIIPLIEGGKIETNKRNIYQSQINWLFFEISFNLKIKK